jgi:hypothetical protein
MVMFNTMHFVDFVHLSCMYLKYYVHGYW